MGKKRVVVYHSGYGCYHSGYGSESGCCGHIVVVGDREEFVFAHPKEGEVLRKFAEQLVAAEFGEEHCADLDWENCVVSAHA